MEEFFDNYGFQVLLIIAGIVYLILGLRSRAVSDNVGGVILFILMAGLGVTYFNMEPSELRERLPNIVVIDWFLEGRSWMILLKVVGVPGGVRFIVKPLIKPLLNELRKWF